jgi:hypothetical protein
VLQFLMRISMLSFDEASKMAVKTVANRQAAKDELCAE